MIAIQVEHLTKVYKDVCAVNDLNLSIPHGQLISLLGVNGAGKTTTIKMLSTLTKPTSGTAYFYGKDIMEVPLEIKSMVALSPQETAVASKLSVKENLELMAGVHGFSKAKTKSRVQEMINLFNLQGVMQKQAKKLSGGWQRRISIAMALISEPQILFLDEPTLGLDVIAKHELWTHIQQLKGHITILLTTHDMQEAQYLCDQVAIMKTGKLLFYGTTSQMIQTTHSSTFEEAFIHFIQEENKI